MACYLLAEAAVAAFAVSLVCHLLALLHIDPGWGQSVLLLHLGIFVLGIPLAIFANRGRPADAADANYLYAELPRWTWLVTPALGTYAVLNLIYYILAPNYHPESDLPRIVVQFFSAAWMAFYAHASVGFIGLARLARKHPQSPATLGPAASPAVTSGQSHTAPPPVKSWFKFVTSAKRK